MPRLTRSSKQDRTDGTDGADGTDRAGGADRTGRAARRERRAHSGGELAGAARPAGDRLPDPRRPGAMGFGVPAYAHPLVAPAEWAELARPGAPLHWAAFDVARGPGSRRDPLYGEVVGRIRENGVPVLGLLDARRGTRPYAELVSDAAGYLEWYRVDGFYLDRAPIDRADAPECRRLVTALRTMLADAGRPPHIVLGHGEHPWAGYAELDAQLVTFNGPWTRYRWSQAPEWTAAYPRDRFAHLVHGLPKSHLETALRIARWQGASTVCLTDRTDRDGADPWAGLPAHWHETVRLLAKQDRVPPPTM